MYLSFFGLNEKPFAITPDPRYLYLSERHAEALAHLLYGINEAGGFVQLTGTDGPVFGPKAAQLFEFDANGKYIREIGHNLYGFGFAHTVRVDKNDNI